MNLKFEREPFRVDTGGAYKAMDVCVVIDSRLTTDEQLASAFYEVLSAYLDPTEDRREVMLDISDALLEAHRFVTRECDESSDTEDH